MKRIRASAALLLMVVFAAGSIGVYLWIGKDVVGVASPYIGHRVWGPLFYIFFSAFGTFVAPFATLPLIPLASGLWGPFATGVYSIVGWGVGAVAAFVLARYLGRPAVSYFVPIEKVDRLGALIPPEREFITVVLLRMVIPVDILSYALGLVSRITLPRYTLATFIGITPFSFVFSYGGGAILGREWMTLGLLAGLGVLLFLLVFIIVRRHGIR